MLVTEEKRFAVIGNPIEHSLSPDIHLPVLQQLCSKVSYEKICVKQNELPEWILRVRREKIDGFNITMPNKGAIIPFLDEIHPDAQVFQAVNTVVNKKGRLYGYNTDAQGLSLSLKKEGFCFKGSKVLLMGSGGAATTIALYAAIKGADQIAILGRNTTKVRKIYDKVNRHYPKIPVHCGKLSEIRMFIEDADILINATPLGMKGFTVDFKDLHFLQKANKEILVCDLIYNPSETSLLKKSKRKRLKTINGLGMLIYQGLLADKLFLNVEFSLEMMYNIVADSLEGRDNPL